MSAGDAAAPVVEDLACLQSLHGYTREELSLVLRPAAGDGKEPTYSMGDDTALPPLAGRGRPLFTPGLLLLRNALCWISGAQLGSSSEPLTG